MRTLKIIAAALVAVSIATACDAVYNDVASTDEVEALRKELKETKAAQKDLQQKYVSQNEDLTQILNEIAAVTGKTATLRSDVESGSARMTQADQISRSITDIKAKIAALEKSASVLSGKNKNFERMIDGFNKVIQEQEQQIFVLRQEIQQKDQKIKDQRDTISFQYQTILEQKEDLERTVARQAKLLYDAGIELEEIADNAPEVSWKKNKEKVANMRQAIYKSALVYFEKAYEADYSQAAEAMARVKAKLTE